MWKDKMRNLISSILKHGKVAFPIILIVAVAFTVFLALSLKSNGNAADGEMSAPLPSVMENEVEQEELVKEVPEDPLMLSTDQAMIDLVTEFFQAKADGDLAVIQRLRNVNDETEEIQIVEFAKYIASYPVIEIYTKAGYQKNSYITYVFYEALFEGHPEQLPGIEALYICTNDNGGLYINNDLESLTVQEQEYMQAVHSQADVEELYNKVNYDYYELLVVHQDLGVYMDELTQEVKKAVGETLAAQIAATQTQEAESSEAATQEDPGAVGLDDGGEALAEEAAAGPVTVYGKATTTVNVRSSDSEQADKIGKVTGGSKVEVLEQKANGWSLVKIPEGEGYIKSEYLEVTPPVEGGEIIGTVTATSNVNIRAEANETADKIGVVTGGEQVSLISRENGWCKITYNGLVGFVKEDYVR
jgi:uncharacterized protein YgiM (DUF1202 family)